MVYGLVPGGAIGIIVGGREVIFSPGVYELGNLFGNMLVGGMVGAFLGAFLGAVLGGWVGSRNVETAEPEEPPPVMPTEGE